MFVDCRTFTKYVHYLTIVVGFQGQPGLVCWSEHIVKRTFSFIMTGTLLSIVYFLHVLLPSVVMPRPASWSYTEFTLRT